MSPLHVYMYLCSRHCILCIFSYSYLSMHMYLLDFRFITNFLIFIYIVDHCLYIYAWTTSLDHVYVWLPEHTNWLYLTYSPGCFLTTLDLYVQIQEYGLCWPYCNWLEGATETWISGCHRSPFLPVLLLIGSRDSWAPLSFWLRLSFSISYFCILWWCNIL